jgi:hypothetical protein
MDNRIDYRQEGYHKGFIDGRRKDGKVNKTYINNNLKDETQSLSTKDSLEFMKAWNEGFADGVIRVTNNMVTKEGLLNNHIYKLD